MALCRKRSEKRNISSSDLKGSLWGKESTSPEEGENPPEKGANCGVLRSHHFKNPAYRKKTRDSRVAEKKGEGLQGFLSCELKGNSKREKGNLVAAILENLTGKRNNHQNRNEVARKGARILTAD